jgi:hypothetical protein
MSCDAWGNAVLIKDGFVTYRNRAIDVYTVNVIQTKGKRVFINHYRENNEFPKMLIMCSNENAATRLYEYLLEEIKVKPLVEDNLVLPNELSQLIHRMNTYFFNFVPSTPSWSFLGCSRH